MELIDRPFGTASYIDTQPACISFDYQYLDYLRHIYLHGVDKADRTGTGARSIFGYMMRFNLQLGFPLLTTKFVPQKTIFDELKWFLEGSTNNNRLREINQLHSKLDWSKKDTIWEEWANKETGELGPIYSEQWRNFPGKVLEKKTGSTEWTPLAFEKFGDEMLAHPDYDSSIKFEGFDQIQMVMDLLAKSPDSRRILVSAWNPPQIEKMALPPCHVLFQFYTRPATTSERMACHLKKFNAYPHPDRAYEELDANNIPKRVVSCMLYQRSCDSVLGVPFNIASYAMLTNMIAHQINMIAGDFVWVGGDCHIYSNHFEQVREQLSRTPANEFPQLEFVNKPASIFQYDWKDLLITNYNPQAAISAPVAV